MKRFHRDSIPALLVVVLLISATLALSACAVRLISSYDSVLDNDVTALQQNTETFLDQLDSEVGTQAATYSKNKDFYIKADADLRTMATRAASEPKSKIIVEEVEGLQKSFSDLQKLHQLSGEKGLSRANIVNARSALESQFTSILTLELALKAHAGTPPAGAPSIK